MTKISYHSELTNFRSQQTNVTEISDPSELAEISDLSKLTEISDLL